MGSEFNSYIHSSSNPTKSELRDEFRGEQEEARDQYGNDTYAGHLGIKGGLDIEDGRIFKDENEACDYIEEHNGKWDSALAVPFKARVSVPSSSRTKAIEAVTKCEKDLADFRVKTLSDIKATKSKTIGCKNCGSSTNRKFVNSFNCVVCGSKNAYLSTTSLNRIKAKQVKLDNFRDKRNNITGGFKDAQGVKYMVGGWCPS
jgi:hypothetical protein